MYKCTINDQQGYLLVKDRVEKGTEFLKDRWFDPKFAKEQNLYMAMAIAMLVYEINTGIFVKNFDYWLHHRGY
jgi:hypothetical protein